MFKEGERKLEYSIQGEELAVDYVEGGGSAAMLKRVLETEGAGVQRISGYATDKLGNLSDEALLRFGNRVAAELGEGWKAAIEVVDSKHYLIFTR